jgi:hypothetical protein
LGRVLSTARGLVVGVDLSRHIKQTPNSTSPFGVNHHVVAVKPRRRPCLWCARVDRDIAAPWLCRP